MPILIFLVWIGLAMAVGIWASKKGRSNFGWFLLAVMVSPLLAGIFLLLVGDRWTYSVQFDNTRYNTKQCPRCAEDIKRAAQVCRFCGHEFMPEANADLAKSDPKPV